MRCNWFSCIDRSLRWVLLTTPCESQTDRWQVTQEAPHLRLWTERISIIQGEAQILSHLGLEAGLHVT